MTTHADLDAREALADLEAAAEAELAATTGIAPRYTREWLEQQAAAGYLACDDPKRPVEQRRYRLPPGHGEVLRQLAASGVPLSIKADHLGGFTRAKAG
jgi:hypothetical protein